MKIKDIVGVEEVKENVDVYYSPDFLDCYTVIIDDYYVYGMSKPRHGKLAFNQFSHDARDADVDLARNGKRMEWHELEPEVQQAIILRYDA